MMRQEHRRWVTGGFMLPRVFLLGVLLVGLAACQHEVQDGATSRRGDAQPAAAPEAAKLQTPILVIAGHSIGEVQLGMSRAAVEGLKLSPHPKLSGMTIPYTVFYSDHAQVTGVELSLRYADRPVEVSGKRIPKGASFQQVQAILAGCEAPVPRLGGTVASCKGGIKVSVGSADPTEVWIRIDT